MRSVDPACGRMRVIDSPPAEPFSKYRGGPPSSGSWQVKANPSRDRVSLSLSRDRENCKDFPAKSESRAPVVGVMAAQELLVVRRRFPETARGDTDTGFNADTGGLGYALIGLKLEPRLLVEGGGE
jgi:hypothetical protein